MGRQVNFFFSQNDEHEFIKQVNKNGFLIMDSTGYVIDDPFSCPISQFYLALPDAKLKYSRYFLCSLESEIIEYSRCELKGNEMDRGRIWAEFRFWNANEEIVRKREVFEKAYEKLARWVKKNSRIDKNKFNYIGPGAYKMYKDDGIKMVLTPRSNGEWE